MIDELNLNYLGHELSQLVSCAKINYESCKFYLLFFVYGNLVERKIALKIYKKLTCIEIF